MKTQTKLAAVALVASIGTAALTAQVTATGRPAPIKLGQPVSPTANTASGDGRVEARLAAMQAEIDQMRAELKDANNKITSLQTVAKNTSLKVFGMAPVVAKFPSHTHFVNSFVVSEAHTPDGRNKNKINGVHSSVPTSECTNKPSSSTDMWNHRWENDWTCPTGS